MSKILYGKLHTIESYEEGNVIATKKEVEKSLFSSRETMLKDIIDSISVITSGETRKLDLCINLDAKGRYRIVSKWGIE